MQQGVGLVRRHRVGLASLRGNALPTTVGNATPYPGVNKGKHLSNYSAFVHLVVHLANWTCPFRGVHLAVGLLVCPLDSPTWVMRLVVGFCSVQCTVCSVLLSQQRAERCAQHRGRW